MEDRQVLLAAVGRGDKDSHNHLPILADHYEEAGEQGNAQDARDLHKWGYLEGRAFPHQYTGVDDSKQDTLKNRAKSAVQYLTDAEITKDSHASAWWHSSGRPQPHQSGKVTEVFTSDGSIPLKEYIIGTGVYVPGSYYNKTHEVHHHAGGFLKWRRQQEQEENQQNVEQQNKSMSGQYKNYDTEKLKASLWEEARNGDTAAVHAIADMHEEKGDATNAKLLRKAAEWVGTDETTSEALGGLSAVDRALSVSPRLHHRSNDPKERWADRVDSVRDHLENKEPNAGRIGVVLNSRGWAVASGRVASPISPERIFVTQSRQGHVRDFDARPHSENPHKLVNPFQHWLSQQSEDEEAQQKSLNELWQSLCT